MNVPSRYFTPNEIAYHNSRDDCWISLLGLVYDLTPLIKEYSHSPLIDPILKFTGKDITHWFDPATKDIMTRIDPITNTEGYYLPMGRFVHVPCPPYMTPYKNEKEYQGIPWWRDVDRYVVGKRSAKTRFIRIINTLVHHEHLLEVCQEETLAEIQQRYLKHNAHAVSYTWKRMGRKLDMNLTLDQNCIVDEEKEFEDLSLNDDYYIPAIHLYYNDDLTIN